MRYKLAPSLIAAGHLAAETAFPLAVRGDIFWPQHPEAADNTQYLHLNDTLVAPIFTSTTNVTSRTVWVPPGDWVDGWSGETVTGPKTLNVSQPFERIPMWHRKGGMVVTTDAPGVRIDDQDWSTLTLETWPDFSSNDNSNGNGLADTRGTDLPTVKSVDRFVFSQQGKGARGARTKISMRTTTTPTSAGGNKVGIVHFAISPADDKSSHAWSVRLHLARGQRVVSATVDGHSLTIDTDTADSKNSLRHLEPLPQQMAHAYFPFGGTSARPAPLAGAVAEFVVEAGTHGREIQLVVQ
jgi:hypothetical protein